MFNRENPYDLLDLSKIKDKLKVEVDSDRLGQ